MPIELDHMQKRVAQAIVHVFETGVPRGDYGKVTLLAGDTGHLTYGKAQTTLGPGNLALLLEGYCAAAGAAQGGALRPYLERCRARDLSLDHDAGFRDALADAGDDPVMHSVQDAFFDRVYWAPTIRSADYIGCTTALGAAIVYDSRVHGSWHARRDETIAGHGTLEHLGEETWFGDYVANRRNWLAHHSNPILRKTVYRMDALDALMDAGAWELALPLTVRGLRLDADSLESGAPVRASAEDDERVLRLAEPHMTGDDVRAVQQALVDAGHPTAVDGDYGPNTRDAVRAFQQAQGLTADGIAGPATRAALDL